METNTRVAKTFRVPHVRHTKSGSRPLTDPRDIYENVANNGARRLRACILSVIPGDVIEEAVAACEETMKSKCDVGPDAQKRLIAAFRELGISREQIERRIQCRVEAIKPAQMVQMRKVYASIRDGMSAAADWFDVSPAAGSGPDSSATSATVDALTSGQGTTTPRETPKPPDDGGPTPEDIAGTIEHPQEDRLPLILKAIERTTSHEAVESIIADEQGAHSDAVFEQIVAAGEARTRQLKGGAK
jgi:hypothetical protein